MASDFERLSTALADRYRIVRELGAGGMATVYLAEDLKHHREVALRVLRRELAEAMGPDRFLQETEVAAQLNHRLGDLYEAHNDTTNAIQYYNEFVELWKDADPELQPLVQDIRRRIGTLTLEPGASN